MRSFCKSKSYSQFFSKNISKHAIFNNQSFNDTLTNDIGRFKKLFECQRGEELERKTGADVSRTSHGCNIDQCCNFTNSAEFRSPCWYHAKFNVLYIAGSQSAPNTFYFKHSFKLNFNCMCRVEFQVNNSFSLFLFYLFIYCLYFKELFLFYIFFIVCFLKKLTYFI